MRLALLSLLVSVLAACVGDVSPSPDFTDARPPSLPPNGTPERPFIGRGVVTEIRDNIIQIDFDTIPGFMPALTMDFPLEDPILADGIEPGQRVVFGVVESRWEDRIVSLRPAD